MRGYISELLTKAVNRGALDRELTVEDKEQILKMLQEFGDLKEKHLTMKAPAGQDARAGVLVLSLLMAMIPKTPP